MDKPENCAICFEKLEEKNPLECGHWMHISCVQKHFKPECPLCRKTLNITVYGQKPEPNVAVFDPQDFDDENEHEDIQGVRFSIRISGNIVGDVVERNVDIFEQEEEDEENNYMRKRRHESDHESEEAWRAKGYQYAEEDSDYDEENPRGDNWNYEDI